MKSALFVSIWFTSWMCFGVGLKNTTTRSLSLGVVELDGVGANYNWLMNQASHYVDLLDWMFDDR